MTEEQKSSVHFDPEKWSIYSQRKATKTNEKEEKSYDRSGYDPMKSNVKDILTQGIENS